MRSPDALVYKLIPDANLFEDRPSLIYSVDSERRGSDGSRLEQGFSVASHWPADFTVFVRGRQPVDYLLCTPWHYAVSLNARRVIERHSASLVEFLPMRMLHESSRESVGEYWVLNVLNVVDALDWQRTRWVGGKVPTEPADARERLIKAAFRLDVVREQAMFLTSVAGHVLRGIYVSGALRDDLRRSRASVGMDFVPCKAT